MDVVEVAMIRAHAKRGAIDRRKCAFITVVNLRLIPFERAGSGNRTHMASVEGWNFTTKLYPQ